MSNKKSAPEFGESLDEVKTASEEPEKEENPGKSDAAEASDKIAAKPPVKSKRKFNARSFKYGTMSVVLTIVFIASVVVINVIVGLISERVDTTADLTDAGIYTLDEKTENYLVSQLNTDVTVTVLRSEKAFEEQNNSYKQVNEILKKMEMAGSHVKLNYLDLNQNPNYTSQFKGETLSADYIVIECEKTGRHRILSPYDYFTLNQYYNAYVVESSRIEQEAVSAMLYVSNDDPVRIAFTEGFGEYEDSAALQNLLSKNGYDVETLNLATTQQIDSDIDIVVMYAPTIDPDNAQLAKLDKFLDNGGAFGKNVFYFASTSQPRTPNIESFLNDWGLSVGYSVIGQSDNKYLMFSDTLYAHLQQICDTVYTKTSAESSLFTFGADLRPVYVLERSSNDIEVLIKTYENAFLYPLDPEERTNFELNSAESGTFNDAAISVKSRSDGTQSRLCVFGTDQISGSVFMSYSNANNQEFFVNLFNYITGKEKGIVIKAKSFEGITFEMNKETVNTLAIVLCFVIPIAVIVLGIVIWIRRRHR